MNDKALELDPARHPRRERDPQVLLQPERVLAQPHQALHLVGQAGREALQRVDLARPLDRAQRLGEEPGHAAEVLASGLDVLAVLQQVKNEQPGYLAAVQAPLAKERCSLGAVLRQPRLGGSVVGQAVRVAKNCSVVLGLDQSKKYRVGRLPRGVVLGRPLVPRADLDRPHLVADVGVHLQKRVARHARDGLRHAVWLLPHVLLFFAPVRDAKRFYTCPFPE